MALLTAGFTADIWLLLSAPLHVVGPLFIY